MGAGENEAPGPYRQWVKRVAMAARRVTKLRRVRRLRVMVRTGRNPRTGDTVSVGAKRVPYFKTGKDLREKLNAARRKAGT